MQHLTGANLHVFLLALVLSAAAIALLFLRVQIPIPAWLRPRFLRAVLEILNDWLRTHGPTLAAMTLPVTTMLALAVLQGGLALYHLVIMGVMFAVLVVWRMR